MAATSDARRAWVHVLEGETVETPPRVAGAPFDPDRPPRAVVEGVDAAFRFDETLLSKHVLFLGSIGSGKTNAMQQLFAALRASHSEDDVFVVFDTKGDFLEDFYEDGDAVISNERRGDSGDATWNLFADLRGEGVERVDDGFEIASTIFGESLAEAGDNFFFAAAARDVFAAVLETMARDGTIAHDNHELRQRLEGSQAELWRYVKTHADLAGVRHYLANRSTGQSVLAFLQQAVRGAFSGSFREAGTFSVRDFVQRKQGRALFIEYDVAKGSVLLPIYRVLFDLAIKEALGRSRSSGSVFFLMDEVALLPHLSHLPDGVNFGRSLGLKFIAGTQNVAQIKGAYGEEVATSILSGFGTVFSFRLMDAPSREFVRQRFGRNRKQVASELAVRAHGVQEMIVEGNVIEDWDLSALTVGTAIASQPEGAPFFFTFKRWR